MSIFVLAKGLANRWTDIVLLKNEVSQIVDAYFRGVAASYIKLNV